MLFTKRSNFNFFLNIKTFMLQNQFDKIKMNTNYYFVAMTHLRVYILRTCT